MEHWLGYLEEETRYWSISELLVLRMPLKLQKVVVAAAE